MKPAVETRERVIRERQFERLLVGASRLEDGESMEARAAILIMGRLGLRAGELTHLDESWVDFRHGVLSIPAYDPCTKGRDGEICGYCRQLVEQHAESETEAKRLAETYWAPKTKGSVRDIPFGWSARVELAIRMLLERHGGWGASYSTAQRRVNQALEAAPGLDVDDTTPHGLRGTAASFHAGAGMEREALRAMFGWRDEEVVKKYLAIDGEMVRRALDEVHQ